MRIVHAFRCSMHPGLYGYTAVRDAKALPFDPSWGEWVYCGKMAVLPGRTRTAVSMAELLSGIERSGYYLFNPDSRDCEFASEPSGQVAKPGEAKYVMRVP